jgi:hypothetical protein
MFVDHSWHREPEGAKALSRPARPRKPSAQRSHRRGAANSIECVNAFDEVKTGATIKLYLADGAASGIRVVSKDNWSGVAVDCSRKDLPRARERDEFSFTGAYVLSDFEEVDEGLPHIYVGESEELGKRLGQHAAKEDFGWRRVVVFASSDSTLNKAHAEYLESRLCQMATAAKRCVLRNKNAPSSPKLSDSDHDQAEVFLREVRLILPVLGITAFEAPPVEAPQSAAAIYELTGELWSGKGVETSEGFKVFEGSTARMEATPAMKESTKQLRTDLIANGALVEVGGVMKLMQDYVFNSPSAAASVLNGSSTNGRTAWKLPDGRTLKEVQEEALGL